MRIDLTYAGLTEQMLQRLRLAAQLLASRQIQAFVRAWDGTRCHVLVALTQDGYGKHAQLIAQRRGTPILAFSTTANHAEYRTGIIAADSLARDIAIALQKIIEDAESRNAPKTTVSSLRRDQGHISSPFASQSAEATEKHGGALVRLASEAALNGQMIQASIRGLTVILRLPDSRVSAASMNDIDATSYLLCDDRWDLKVTSLDAAPTHLGLVTRSLDAYFLSGALQSPEKLPLIPPDTYWLDVWPDLGSSPQFVDSLKIIQVLLRGPIGVQELAAVGGFDIMDVSACLWALRATGLLRSAQHEAPPSKPKDSPRVEPLSGLLGRIASRFGVSTWRAKNEDAV
jgi:hypothetical protein